jgi:hypothetical protein
MRDIRRLLCGLLVILLFCLGSGTARAEGSFIDSSQPFESINGHIVQGEFLKFYRSASDPLLVFGYPITDEFVDPVTHVMTQYFQKARFDLISTTAGPIIELAPLGQSMHTGVAPTASIPTNGSACRFFQQTGKNVCFAFLQF